MDETNNFIIYGGYGHEVYGVHEGPVNSYVIYNPEIEDYNPYYVYLPYYVYVPINYYYYVTYVYYTVPAYDGNTFIDAAPFHEGLVISSSEEDNLDTYDTLDYSLYNTGNGSKEIVGEEQTTFDLYYEEYTETLNDAPVDNEEKNGSSNEKLESDVVSNRTEVNPCITVDEQSYSIETNLCGDDVDRNLIRKISSLSIDDVKEDIDENYENGKAFLYNQVLKGYTEIKSQLEDLEWECHSLDDIPEEDEEEESESSDMELNENVLKDCENINVKKMYLTVVEEKSSPLSEESLTALNEETLDEESRSLSDKSQTAAYEESLVEECGSLNEESQTAENEEALVEEYQSLSEESQKAENEESLVEECGSLNEESTTAENEEKSVEECLSLREEAQIAENEEALDEQCLSLSKESQTAANEEPLVEERRLLSEESETAEHDEALVEENPKLTEESQPSIDSTAVEESQKVDLVPDVSSSNNEIDSAYENPDQNVSSQDVMEERAAAPKSKQRKKRFSRLRKFFGRICCCITKPP